MQKTVIVRYGELALKSEPVRRRFERHLISEIELTLRGLKHVVRRDRGRIFVDTNSPTAVIKRLSRVPGIVSVSQATKVAASMDKICSSALNAARKVLSPGMSFAVRTSRAGEHPFSSRDVNVEVGSAILSKIKGVRVNLSSPDREIFVEVRGGDAYIFTKTTKGVGGLPVGTQGRVVAIFSGGRNDAAAAYLMMKRGCAVFPILFDLRPRAGSRASRLASTSARRLANFSPKLELRVIPFGGVVEALSKVVAGGAAYIIYRRSIMRAAEAIAWQVGAEAIVAGDDAKQIAAQKLANLYMIDSACRLPVLRPLAGIDHGEMDQLVGISLSLEHKAAQPFSPPTDIEKLDEIERVEDGMKIGVLIEEAVKKVGVVKLR